MDAAELLVAIKSGEFRISAEPRRGGHSSLVFLKSHRYLGEINCVKGNPPAIKLVGLVVSVSSSFEEGLAIECDTAEDAIVIFNVLNKGVLHEFECAWDIRTREQVEDLLGRGNAVVVSENLEAAAQIHRDGLTELRRPAELPPDHKWANLAFQRIEDPASVPQIGDVLTLVSKSN